MATVIGWIAAALFLAAFLVHGYLVGGPRRPAGRGGAAK